MSKFGAIIVTFNPVIELLKSNINAIVDQVDALILVDNGSKNIEEIEKLIQGKSNIKICKLDSNLGIAKAQNAGMVELCKENFDWSLILDQDSIVPKNTIEVYRKTRQFEFTDTAILAARHIDNNWNDQQKESYFGSLDNKVISVDMVIASGNLVKIEAWKNVGGFDEKLFIDQVDFDFDVKLLMMKYKIYQVDEVIMEHEIGETIQRPLLSKILLYKTATLFIDHSAFREYYISRNSIIFAKRYPEFRPKGKLQILKIILDTRKLLGYKRPRFAKIISSIKGIKDGLLYSTKKDIEFQNFLRKLN